LAEEGWRGLFKGFSLNIIKGPITLSLSLTTYDILRNWIENEWSWREYLEWGHDKNKTETKNVIGTGDDGKTGQTVIGAGTTTPSPSGDRANEPIRTDKKGI
jgi:hypothetical protein